MEDFTIEKYITGIAICRNCGMQFKAQVKYGEFVNLRCLNCGVSITELHNPHITGIINETTA